MTDRQRHAGGEQEQRPAGGVEDEAEQEVAQGERSREHDQELKAPRPIAPIPNARTPVVPSLAGPTPLGPLSRSGGASPWPRP